MTLQRGKVLVILFMLLLCLCSCSPRSGSSKRKKSKLKTLSFQSPIQNNQTCDRAKVFAFLSRHFIVFFDSAILFDDEAGITFSDNVAKDIEVFSISLKENNVISRGSEDIEHEECGDNSCNIGGIDAEMKKRQSENGASTEERGENGKKRAKIRKERRELHSRNEKRAKRIEKASSISMAGRRDNPIQEQLIQHQESPESVDTTSFSFITSESVTQELSWLRTFDSLRDGVYFKMAVWLMYHRALERQSPWSVLVDTFRARNIGVGCSAVALSPLAAKIAMEERDEILNGLTAPYRRLKRIYNAWQSRLIKSNISVIASSDFSFDRFLEAYRAVGPVLECDTVVPLVHMLYRAQVSKSNVILRTQRDHSGMLVNASLVTTRNVGRGEKAILPHFSTLCPGEKDHESPRQLLNHRGLVIEEDGRSCIPLSSSVHRFSYMLEEAGLEDVLELCLTEDNVEDVFHRLTSPQLIAVITQNDALLNATYHASLEPAFIAFALVSPLLRSRWDVADLAVVTRHIGNAHEWMDLNNWCVAAYGRILTAEERLRRRVGRAWHVQYLNYRSGLVKGLSQLKGRNSVDEKRLEEKSSALSNTIAAQESGNPEQLPIQERTKELQWLSQHSLRHLEVAIRRRYRDSIEDGGNRKGGSRREDEEHTQQQEKKEAQEPNPRQEESEDAHNDGLRIERGIEVPPEFQNDPHRSHDIQL